MRKVKEKETVGEKRRYPLSVGKKGGIAVKGSLGRPRWLVEIFNHDKKQGGPT